MEKIVNGGKIEDFGVKGFGMENERNEMENCYDGILKNEKWGVSFEVDGRILKDLDISINGYYDINEGYYLEKDSNIIYFCDENYNEFHKIVVLGNNVVKLSDDLKKIEGWCDIMKIISNRVFKNEDIFFKEWDINNNLIIEINSYCDYEDGGGVYESRYLVVRMENLGNIF